MESKEVRKLPAVGACLSACGEDLSDLKKPHIAVVYSPNTVVVEFPIKEKFFERSKNDVSLWEQLENAAMYQKHWSDNQVSITVTFKPYFTRSLK